MGKIYGSLEELIGKTPLAAFSRYEKAKGLKSHIFGKMEYFNPGGSAKDRIAVTMLDEAEKAGLIRRDAGYTIIESTSGNTGVGLAAVAPARGYRTIIVMPETMSDERKNLLRAHGAILELTPGNLGLSGAVARAQELLKTVEKSWMPEQFKNPAGPLAHYRTTGPEIWEDLDGKVDVFLAGAGTGGTVSGTGKFLKEKNPDVKIIAIEPEKSPVLSGGKAGPHNLQGIGPGFVPETFDRTVIDEIIRVSEEDAYRAGRELTAHEGFIVGITGGAVLWAAGEVAKRPEMKGKNIVCLLADSGERYLSTEMYRV